MATGLAERGCRVTIFCAAYAGGAPDETVDGVRFVRRGSKMSVYLAGMWALLRRQLGRVDVVLVHHVHREQWPVVYPGVTGRVGWWIEHWLAPRLYRDRQYVAVSRATRA